MPLMSTLGNRCPKTHPQRVQMKMMVQTSQQTQVPPGPQSLVKVVSHSEPMIVGIHHGQKDQETHPKGLQGQADHQQEEKVTKK